jgi:Ankyrin repeats (many copies)
MADIIAMALKLKQNPNNKEKALRTFTSYRIYPDKTLYHKKPYLKFQLRLLFWCAHFDDTEMAQYFMERKVSPFEPSHQGYSPFHRAA